MQNTLLEPLSKMIMIDNLINGNRITCICLMDWPFFRLDTTPEIFQTLTKARKLSGHLSLESHTPCAEPAW